MKYLKRTGYTFLILQLSILIGVLLGGILAFPLRLFDDLSERQTELLYAVVVTLVVAISLFIAQFKDAYDKRQFNFTQFIGSFILIAIIRIPIGLIAEYGGTVAGCAGYLARVIFLSESQYYFLHNGIEALAEGITMLGIDLLIYLPALLLGGYCGCKKHQKEIKELTGKDIG